jgi:cytochrome c biogenesis protein CcmG/thiol:disulfide interchange protein DsbE
MEKSNLSTKPRATLGQILVWTAVLTLLIIIAIGLMAQQQPPIAQGKPAPDFTLSTFDGQTFNTADLRGKVLVINFWASWCKPCEQEAADLEAAWRYYKDRGDVVFLGIAWTDTEPNSLRYLTKFDITYPNGPDLGTRISQRYRTTGVPETYIVDQDGILVNKKISPYQSLAEIKAAIDPLLVP